jgi:hypothetical protein
MKDLISEVANKLLYEQTPEEIHAYLIAEGMTEGDAFLTYQAGKILLNGRIEAAAIPIAESFSTRYKR